MKSHFGGIVLLAALASTVGGCGGTNTFPTFFELAITDSRITGDGDLLAPAFAARTEALAITQRDLSGFLTVVRFRNNVLEPVSLVDGMPPSPPDAQSFGGAISATGDIVAFISDATNLVPEGTREDRFHVYVRDLRTGDLELVTRAPDGSEANGSSTSVAVAGNGRFIFFASTATNLDPDATNGGSQIYLFDRATREFELVTRDFLDDISVSDAALGDSLRPAASPNGRFVVFDSDAPDLVRDDTNVSRDVFLFDRTTETMKRLSIDSTGAETLLDARSAAVSDDGLFVAFTALDLSGSGAVRQVFVRDLAADTTSLVSMTPGGIEGGGDSDEPSISGNGRFIAFHSDATDLVAGDTNGFRDVFVYDRVADAMARVSLGFDGSESNGPSDDPALSGDGRSIAFSSAARNLVDEPLVSARRNIFLLSNPLD